MKKQYIQPAQEAVTVETVALLSASLNVSNEAQNNVSGDVKADKGDWDAIWE